MLTRLLEAHIEWDAVELPFTHFIKSFALNKIRMIILCTNMGLCSANTKHRCQLKANRIYTVRPMIFRVFAENGQMIFSFQM